MVENRRKNFILKNFIMVFLVMFIIIAPGCVFAQEERNQLGDINGDAKIDTTDLVIMLRHISAKKTNKNREWILAEEKVKRGDINQNNEIDSSDILVVLRYIAAKKSSVVASKHKEWMELEKIGSIDKSQEETENIPEKEKEPEITQNKEEKEPSKNEEQQILPEKIALNQQEISMDLGQIIKLSTMIVPETANSHRGITWNSSDSNIVTVSDEGTITAKASGKATITVMTENGKTATCMVTVNNPVVEVTEIKLNKKNLSLEVNDGERLIATILPENALNKTLTWTSSDTNIVTVNQNGFVTAKSEGTANIMVKTANGKTATCTVIVKKLEVEVTSISFNRESINLKENDGERLTVTVQPENATNKVVTWSSSNDEIATVSNGLVTAKKAGTASITAKTANGKTATCTVIVENSIIEVTAIKLSMTKFTIYEEDTKTITATIKPLDATNKSIIWGSTNSSIASVNSKGKVTAKKEGIVTIVATSKSNPQITAKCQVTVKNRYSTPSSTKTKSVNGDGYTQTIKLGGRTFKLYKQGKGSYSSVYYNSTSPANKTNGCVADKGCGPASMAIILSGYGSKYNPGHIAQKCTSSARKLSLTPSSMENMTKVAKSLGRDVKTHYGYNKDYNQVYKQMKNALANGHQIILYVSGGPGTTKSARLQFSRGAHFISVLGIDTSNNQVFVGNPGVLGKRDSGWFSLSTVVKARGNSNSNFSMKGWLEIY